MDVDSLMRGKFTLKDMYQQMEAMNKLGPLKQIMQMLPMGGLGMELSDKEYQMTKDRLDKYRVVMDSMTEAELEDPKIITASRIKRISRGSGAISRSRSRASQVSSGHAKSHQRHERRHGQDEYEATHEEIFPGNEDARDVSASDLPLAVRNTGQYLSIRHLPAVISQNGAAFRGQAEFVEHSA